MAIESHGHAAFAQVLERFMEDRQSAKADLRKRLSDTEPYQSNREWCLRVSATSASRRKRHVRKNLRLLIVRSEFNRRPLVRELLRMDIANLARV